MVVANDAFVPICETVRICVTNAAGTVRVARRGSIERSARFVCFFPLQLLPPSYALSNADGIKRSQRITLDKDSPQVSIG